MIILCIVLLLSAVIALYEIFSEYPKDNVATEKRTPAGPKYRFIPPEQVEVKSPVSRLGQERGHYEQN